jgi:hypothetical protein
MRLKLRSLSELPRELSPTRDLWPQIAAQITAPPVARRRSSTTIAWALAAGMAALACGILLGRLTLPVTGAGVAGVQAEGFVDAAYAADRSRLRATVIQRLGALPPSERARVLGSIRALQRAVDDIQAALGVDPGNALLQELLVNACQDEMNTLNDINIAAGGQPPRRTVETTL